MSITKLRTETATFGLSDKNPLFSVNKGFDLIDALEHASALLECSNHLSLAVAGEQAGVHAAYASHYLGEMAKAVVEACLTGAISGNGGDHEHP